MELKVLVSVKLLQIPIFVTVQPRIDCVRQLRLAAHISRCRYSE